MSGDALLLSLLALLNESADMDRALQDSLDMMTAATRGCIGEIWLRTGEARDVELHYSSSDGSPAVAAFVAGTRFVSGPDGHRWLGGSRRRGSQG
jgi:hypothetical protein